MPPVVFVIQNNRIVHTAIPQKLDHDLHRTQMLISLIVPDLQNLTGNGFSPITFRLRLGLGKQLYFIGPLLCSHLSR